MFGGLYPFRWLHKSNCFPQVSGSTSKDNGLTLRALFVGSADIKRFLPVEGARFQNINTGLLTVLEKAYKSPFILDVKTFVGIATIGFDDELNQGVSLRDGEGVLFREPTTLNGCPKINDRLSRIEYPMCLSLAQLPTDAADELQALYQ